MKLPNADQATVDLRKLRDYCLNPNHPRGRHKARVFASERGLSGDRAEDFAAIVLIAARTLEAVPGEVDSYGHRYLADLEMPGRNGPVAVRSARIIRTGEDYPRLTSCYVF